MHFSIPDTQQLKDDNGSNYVGYNIHVNGAFHCTVRYKQLNYLHEQLKKAIGPNSLPFFPPKKILPLTLQQKEERRAQLEKYIQIISQDQRIIHNELFNGFLLNAQQETLNTNLEEVILDVFQMNWQSIKIKVYSNDRTDIVLDNIANALNLPTQFIPYFCLYIIKREDKNCIPIRRLQNFESPYLTLKSLDSVRNNLNVVIRKKYWDSIYDDDLLDNRAALNILYSQTLYDVERNILQTTKEIRRQLTGLQAKGSKKEYLQLARTLKFYGCLKFEQCLCDYPQPNTIVQITACGKELHMIANLAQEQKEFNFRVTRIRCWRLTASLNGKSNGCASSSSNNDISHFKYELSFEYLISKDNLQWIAVTSEQAILMSVCLQGMVEELLMKRNGQKFKRESDISNDNKFRRGSWSYMKRDGSSQQITIPRSISNDHCANINDEADNSKKMNKVSKPQNGYSKNRSFVENHAFDEIGDEDL